MRDLCVYPRRSRLGGNLQPITGFKKDMLPSQTETEASTQRTVTVSEKFRKCEKVKKQKTRKEGKSTNTEPGARRGREQLALLAAAQSAREQLAVPPAARDAREGSFAQVLGATPATCRNECSQSFSEKSRNSSQTF